MVEGVKGTSGRRQEKALATRRRVLDAAETLFVRDGFTATTMITIADVGDVAVQTVYALFGNKRTILTELLRRRTVGDDEAAPLREREEWQVMEREPDPYRQIALLAAIATRVGARMAGLYEVMVAAASSDPEIAELFEGQQQLRYNDQRRVARALSRRRVLRSGLSETHAADSIWTLANPQMYGALVNKRRWPVDEYEHWLTHQLTCALLEPHP